MSVRFYSNYDSIRNFVNKDKLPTSKEQIDNISEIFLNFTDNTNYLKAIKYHDVELKTIESGKDWKERRETIKNHRIIVRRLLSDFLHPKLVRIEKKKRRRKR